MTASTQTVTWRAVSPGGGAGPGSADHERAIRLNDVLLSHGPMDFPALAAFETCSWGSSRNALRYSRVNAAGLGFAIRCDRSWPFHYRSVLSRADRDDYVHGRAPSILSMLQSIQGVLALVDDSWGREPQASRNLRRYLDNAIAEVEQIV